MKVGILIHEPNDDVGVAVMDLAAGAQIGAATLEGVEMGTVKIVEDIPLGHKVALKEIPERKGIVEYGRAIGNALQPIATGAHVHIHNLKTTRWSQ